MKPKNKKRLLLGIGGALIALLALWSATYGLANLSPIWLFLSQANAPVSSPTRPAAESPTVPVEEAPQSLSLDYVELLKQAEDYNYEQVRLAGRVGAVEQGSYDTTLYFFDRLNYYATHATELKIYLQTDPEVEIQKGDYVIVEGEFDCGSGYPPRHNLSHASLLAVGEEAEKEAKAYQEKWEAERLRMAEQLPLKGLMELARDGSGLDDTYVRTAVKVSEIQSKSWEINDSNSYFYLYDERTKKEIGTVDLTGLTPEVIAAIEGQTVLICGLLGYGSRRISLVDCYVEAIGARAEEEAARLSEEWQAACQAEREAYLSACVPLDYRSVLQHPTSYQDAKLTCSGTVVEIRDSDPLSASFIIELSDEPGKRIEVLYYNGAADDPHILLGVPIVVYGYVFDVYYPADATGAHTEALPEFRAQYIEQ